MQFDPDNRQDQSEVNSLTLQLIIAATVGTLAATGISYILKMTELGAIKPELLFIPWGIALVFGVSIGFQRGVHAERRRVQAQDDKNKGDAA